MLARAPPRIPVAAGVNRPGNNGRYNVAPRPGPPRSFSSDRPLPRHIRVEAADRNAVPQYIGGTQSIFLISLYLFIILLTLSKYCRI